MPVCKTHPESVAVAICADCRDALRAEIARLREELGRAVVRNATLRKGLTLAGDVIQDAVEGNAWPEPENVEGVLEILESPSPLADAAWEVLQAAVELSSERAAPYASMAQFEEHQDRVDELLVLLDSSVDRFRALLEGRNKEED